jgi:hypothetical protein
MSLKITDSPMANQESSTVTFRDALSSTIRYWEPRRLVFNFALLLVVGAAFVAGLPVSKRALAAEPLLTLFILAVLANVAYCAAYVPDLVIQLSSFRARWLQLRWLLLTIGILFASAITYFFAAGMFGLADGNWQ